MARKGALLSVILVTVLALLVVSCGPRASTPAPATPGTPTPAVSTPAAPTPTTPTPAVPSPASSTERPKYGGTINLIQTTNIEIFSPVATARPVNELSGTVYEQFTQVDRTKGPAGTGETDYGSGIADWKYVTGFLAESFEVVGVDVWKLNIRKGVHWALNQNSEASRLVGGREMTADDAAWSISVLTTNPNSYVSRSNPGLAKNTTVEKTGPWQITVKTPVEPGLTLLWIMGGGGSQYVFAKEAVEKYGGDASNWQQTVGTGAFMLTDYVSGSVATFIRNPNYWQRNPVGPGKGDQLPYADGVKIFIVPDLSTRLAAVRTGKADWIEDIEGEDARGLLKSIPGLQSYKYIPRTMAVGMRADKPDLPYKDVRVRQALMMATDFEALKNDLYGGEAEILTLPVTPTKGNPAYISLAQLPEAVQSLYKYNPERAKQLLAEAGYPNGFKAKIIVQSTSSDLDSVAAFKAMWAKVGVDLEIQPKEAAVFNSINLSRAHDELVFRQVLSINTLYGTFTGYRGSEWRNSSYVNDPPGKDPAIEKAFEEVQKNVLINYPTAYQTIRDVIPYILEQAHYITRPSPYSYRVWQPWLKNYYGETGLVSLKYWIQHTWVDQDLKEKMTGRR